MTRMGWVVFGIFSLVLLGLGLCTAVWYGHDSNWSVWLCNLC